MTMTKPEMDVVRFNESDVIVASSPVPPVEHRYVTISGLGTGTVGDAKWVYTNGGTSTATIGKYQEDQHNNTLKGEVKYISGQNHTTLGDMVSGGDADGLFIEFNGFYETFDQGLSWHKQQ